MTVEKDDLNFLIEDEKNSKAADEDVHLDETSDFCLEPEITTADTSQINATNVSSGQNESFSIDLNKDKFSVFMSIMQMMKYSCQDLFVKNGRITQINSKKSMFFDIDVSPIFGKNSFVIGGISSKYDLLSPFKKQGVDVFLDVTPTGYIFRDAQSKIYSKRPVESFLEPVYMTEQQIQNKTLIDYNRRIFSYTWQKRMLDRVVVFAKTLATPVIRIECKKDVILCKAQSLDNSSTSYIDLLELEDEVDDCTIDNLVVPFPSMCWINFIQGGIVEISSELYHTTFATPAAALKLSGKIEIPNTDPINVNIVGGSWFSPIDGSKDGAII